MVSLCFDHKPGHCGFPAPVSCHPVIRGACIRSLRIIHSTPKPATMSPLYHYLRGHCHGTNSLCLPPVSSIRTDFHAKGSETRKRPLWVQRIICTTTPSASVQKLVTSAARR